MRQERRRTRRGKFEMFKYVVCNTAKIPRNAWRICMELEYGYTEGEILFLLGCVRDRHRQTAII